MKLKRLTLTAVLGIALMAAGILLSSTAPTAHAEQPIDQLTIERQYDLFVVAVRTADGWRDAAALTYDQFLTEQRIDLSSFSLAHPVQVRVTHAGDTASHVDRALLGDQAPATVEGTNEEAALALRKLARRDNDLIDVQGKTVTLTYARVPQDAIFSLVARMEPQIIPKAPFRFPVENAYEVMDSSAAFYTYVLGSQPGSLSIDGNLDGESLAEPFFKVFCEPVTGHPSSHTRGWVRNDERALYVAIDFAADNTMDGAEDYAAVYVDTSSGLRRFEVSVPRKTWGSPGFAYTDAAVYQHKVYEFRIPLVELGLEGSVAGQPLSIAFEAYGTASEAEGDARALKTNSVGGIATPGIPFTWTVSIVNDYDCFPLLQTKVTFHSGATLLTDTLPAGMVYGTVSLDSRGQVDIYPAGTKLSDALDCSWDDHTLVCVVKSTHQIDLVTWDEGPDAAIDISFTATALTPGIYHNPPPGGICKTSPTTHDRDPDNNDCSDSVTVGGPVGGYTAPLALVRSMWPRPLLLVTVLLWLVVAGAVVSGQD